MPIDLYSQQQAVGDATRNAFAEFIRNNGGVIQGQLDSLRGNDIIQEGLAQAQRVGGRSRRNLATNSARYGLGMTPAQRASLARMTKLSDAKVMAGSINDSRMQQRERNTAVASSLAQQGNSIYGQGLNTLNTTIAMGTQRRDANLQAQQNASLANRGQLLGYGLSAANAMSMAAF